MKREKLSFFWKEMESKPEIPWTRNFEIHTIKDHDKDVNNKDPKSDGDVATHDPSSIDHWNEEYSPLDFVDKNGKVQRFWKFDDEDMLIYFDETVAKEAREKASKDLFPLPTPTVSTESSHTHPHSHHPGPHHHARPHHSSSESQAKD